MVLQICTTIGWFLEFTAVQMRRKYRVLDKEPRVVVHARNPSSWEVENLSCLCSRVQGQPEFFSSKKKKTYQGENYVFILES